MLNQASERLKKLNDKIMHTWEERALKEIDASFQQNSLALRNSLPEFLDHLASALSTTVDRTAARVKWDKDESTRLGKKHGKDRASMVNYTIDQLIFEYHILRQVICDVMEKEAPLSEVEREVIVCAVEASVNDAATQFSQTLRDNQKNITHKLSSEVNFKDQLLKTIINRVEDYALFTLDSKGNISSWAYGAHRIKQYTAEEVIGNHYSMLYPPEGKIRNEPEKHLAIAREEGRFRGEGLRQRKNGELFMADVFITPMYEKDELIGYFKIVTDITERNKLMQEIDLSRSQVEALEVESVLRDRFIYMLTHDLRNPIQAAKMSSEMITRQACNVEKHLDFARRSILHISRVDKMISDLLDASRIREGEPFPIQIAECDLIKIVNEVLDELATLHGDRFDIEGPDVMLGFWDGKGLRRAIENLTTNAVKYGDPANRISIRLTGVENRVIIKVHNFGAPINTQDQESLFEIFKRTASAKKGTSKGWGLGLTLVRGITEAHGGIVKVRSLPKEGTTFTLDLPLDARTESDRSI